MSEKKRILVVEDDDVLRIMTERQLQHLGYLATTSNDGAAALQALKQAECVLILMDVQMPIMDGLEATRAIRRDEAERSARRVPIVAMTAHPNKDKCFEAGMDDFLFKPITLERLAATISKWLAP